MLPTPPALYEMPPPDHPPTPQPNYAEHGHEPTLPPDMLIPRDPPKIQSAAKRGHRSQVCSDDLLREKNGN